MKSLLHSLILATGLTAMQASASGGLEIDDPFARAVPPGTPNSAVFFTIENEGTQDRAIVSASSPAAKVVELHTHIMEDGMAKMREVPRILVPAGGETKLKPGGLHVMLLGLHHDLVEGEAVSVTLNFDDGTGKTFSAPIRRVKRMMKHAGKHHDAKGH